MKRIIFLIIMTITMMSCSTASIENGKTTYHSKNGYEHTHVSLTKIGEDLDIEVEILGVLNKRYKFKVNKENIYVKDDLKIQILKNSDILLMYKNDKIKLYKMRNKFESYGESDEIDEHHGHSH